MTWTLLQHVKKAGGAGSATITTTGIDTTGASLIVVHVASWGQESAPGVTDSLTMAGWHSGTVQDGGGSGNARSQLFYISSFDGSFATNASHTFSTTVAGTFQSMEVQVWSGSLSSGSPLRDQSGDKNEVGGDTSAVSAASVGAANDLIIAGVFADVGTSFTLTGASGTDKNTSDTQSFVGGTTFGSAMAYDRGTSGAGVSGAENLQLNWTAAAQWAITSMAFKPGAAAGSKGATHYYSGMSD